MITLQACPLISKAINSGIPPSLPYPERHFSTFLVLWPPKELKNCKPPHNIILIVIKRLLLNIRQIGTPLISQTWSLRGRDLAEKRWYCNEIYFRPLETPEQNVRRLAAKPDIVLPHPDCVDTNLSQIVTCEECGVLYCSNICRENAYVAYHRTLCYNPSDDKHPMVNLMEAWK